MFVDPAIAVWKYYPQPFGMHLCWGILVLVFIGFNLGMAGFSSLMQPLHGLAAKGMTLSLAFAIAGAIVHGYGLLDPGFNATRNAGYGAVGPIVPIGLCGFGIVATGLGAWPWSDAGLSPAMDGFAQLAISAAPPSFGSIWEN